MASWDRAASQNAPRIEIECTGPGEQWGEDPIAILTPTVQLSDQAAREVKANVIPAAPVNQVLEPVFGPEKVLFAATYESACH